MDEDAYKKYNRPESGHGVGVYKHPDTKEELWASSHPQADAMVRQGWVYDRPLPAANERRKVAPSAQETVADETGVDPNKDASSKDEARSRTLEAAKENADQGTAEVVGQNQGTQPKEKKGNK